MFKNFHKRTFVKGLTWEGSGLITLFLITYFGIMPDVLTASIFTVIYTALRVGMYYAHERFWKKTSWGKPKLTKKRGKSKGRKPATIKKTAATKRRDSTR